MSDLTASDREIVRMIFERERHRIRRAFVDGDAVMLACALAEISAAIEGIPGWAETKQRGATKEQLEYRAKRFGYKPSLRLIR